MTSASGMGAIMDASDGSVSETIITARVEGTLAHIHEAQMGQNGSVIVLFTNTANNV